MYTIDKLQTIIDNFDNESNESIIARYLLEHLGNLHDISLKNCVLETGISKSSIHRFFSSGGFHSFQELVDILMKEMTSDFNDDIEKQRMPFVIDEQFSVLCAKINQAQCICFYGNQQEINQLYLLKKYLRKQKKMFYILNSWNIHVNMNKLNYLHQKDLLIIMDTSLTVQDLYEISMNYQNILPLYEISNKDFTKIFIGERNCSSSRGFINISLSQKYDHNIIDFDSCLYHQLMKRGKS